MDDSEENLVVKCDHMEQSYQCTLRNKKIHRLQIRYVGLRRLVVSSVSLRLLLQSVLLGIGVTELRFRPVDKSKVKVSPFACH